VFFFYEKGQHAQSARFMQVKWVQF